MVETPWISPRVAVAKVRLAYGISRDDAIEALVRWLLHGKIIAVADEYRGPKDEGNCLNPEYPFGMPLWRGVWRYDVFRKPSSPAWTVGDLEASLGSQSCFWFGLRFRSSDVSGMLARDIGDTSPECELPDSPLPLSIPPAPLGPPSKFEIEGARGMGLTGRYLAADFPLILEMHAMVAEGATRRAAADKLAGRAAGFSERTSKVDRLRRLYSDWEKLGDG